MWSFQSWPLTRAARSHVSSYRRNNHAHTPCPSWSYPIASYRGIAWLLLHSWYTSQHKPCSARRTSGSPSQTDEGASRGAGALENSGSTTEWGRTSSARGKWWATWKWRDLTSPRLSVNIRFCECLVTTTEHESNETTNPWWNNPFFILYGFGMIDSRKARKCTNPNPILVDQWKSFFYTQCPI